MIPSAELGGVQPHSIHIGGVYAGRKNEIVRTVLGSCIAVCLHDPIAKVGGMNHFMLPHGSADDGPPTRYGIHAMELLINRCMQLGADRKRLEAKVFGGGHVLNIVTTATPVPESNIQFALDFLQTEGIPVVAKDVGGYAAREVYFFTGTAKILLKRLAKTGLDLADQKELEREEKNIFNAPKKIAQEGDSNITLFH